MKKAVLLFIITTIQACSSADPTLDQLISYDEYYASAALDRGQPSNPYSITALGVGVKRLPQDVLEREIRVSPPGIRPLNNPEITISYGSIVPSLPPLPRKYN